MEHAHDELSESHAGTPLPAQPASRTRTAVGVALRRSGELNSQQSFKRLPSAQRGFIAVRNLIFPLKLSRGDDKAMW